MTGENIDRKALSRRIKLMRIEQDLSQADLAERGGFARSTLSKIENGLLSPTFELLLKVARGLGTELTELLQPEDHAVRPAGRMIVTRGTPAPVVEDHATRLSPLAPQLKNRGFQPCFVSFTCSDLSEFGPWNSHPTEDFLYVVSGRLAFHSEGYAEVILLPGDSIHFDGSMKHACLAADDEPCRCIYVYCRTD